VRLCAVPVCIHISLEMKVGGNASSQALAAITSLMQAGRHWTDTEVQRIRITACVVI
jgi:hypothetical protein